METVRTFKIEAGGGGYSAEEWFDESIRAFRDVAPSTRLEDYDYVQLVPLSSYRRYFSGNDGAQGWRHRTSGWTIPDYCRQAGGRPEIWTKTRKHNLEVSDGSPVLDFLIID